MGALANSEQQLNIKPLCPHTTPASSSPTATAPLAASPSTTATANAVGGGGHPFHSQGLRRSAPPSRSTGGHLPPGGQSPTLRKRDFVSAYHGFVTLGDEHIPQPVEYCPFPVFAAEFVSASVANSSDQRILLRLSMPLEKEPERYALLCKVQLTEAGKGCNPGKMRNFLAEEVTEDDIATGSCPSRPVALTIPVRTAFPGVSAATYSLHLRYMLIDRLTGYRSQYQKLSTVINIT